MKGIRTVLLILLSIFGLTLYGQESKLDLRDESFEAPVSLSGEWQFYWSELIVNPRFFSNPPISVEVPHRWSDEELNEERLPKRGFASYARTIILSGPHPALGLEIPHVFSAYKVIVNGKVLHETGKVADNELEYAPARIPAVISLKEVESDTLNLVIQVTNFDYNKSGLYEEIFIGAYAQLLSKFNQRLSFSLFVAGGLFISGFIVLIFSVIYKQLMDQIPFYGLFSISMMYHMVGSDTYPLHIIFPYFNFNVALHLEHLTIYAASIASGLFMYGFYKRQINVWVIRFFYAVTILATIILFVCPPIVFTEVLDVYFVFLGVFILFYLAIIIKAWRVDKFAPTPVVVALGMIFLWSIMEIANHLNIAHTPFAIHVILMATIIIFSNFALIQTFLNKINKAKLSKAEQGYEKSRQTMLSLISHEIKMPVATLQMNMEMMKRASDRPERFEKVKDKVIALSLNAVDTIKRMLHDFIYFMSLNQQANESVNSEELKAFIAENWSLEVYAQNGVDQTRRLYKTDKVTLKYILNTLINNAEKFSRPEDKPTEIHILETTSQLTIEVRDHGVGISDEQLEKLGTLQPRVDENQEITGMGFYLAKDLSERLEHDLKVVSRGKEGTSVFLSMNGKR